MTSYSEEKAEQQKWTACLRFPVPAYDQLLENEFKDAEQQRIDIARSLGKMLRFASRQVPYYREGLSQTNAEMAGHDPTKLLVQLPILKKLDVQDNVRALRAKKLPPRDRPIGWSSSSGTTGRPTRVLHSMFGARMYGFLLQRGCRWFRLDPSRKFATMRTPDQLPRVKGSGKMENGGIVNLQNWPHMEPFDTGPFAGINIFTPVEERLEWLRRERPDYLATYSESLEHLGFAAGAERPVEGLKAIIAISEQLTPSMQTYVERVFGAPVYQHYALSEIELVATRCEAGRYHVHREHCFVEVVDENGRACPPGETGRIVVTSLTNFAMPLLRYDTGDLAEAKAGTCSCNRTLPSFGDIVGRYSRVSHLPDGTLPSVFALRDAIESMPADLMHGLREFQIHQFRDRHMELRIVARSPMPSEFYTRIREVWAELEADSKHELTFCYVDELARSASGKCEVFTSDFMPAADAAPPDSAASKV